MGTQAAGAGVESLIVVDTDIFIDHFRGVQSASDYLQNIPSLVTGNIRHFQFIAELMSIMRNI